MQMARRERRQTPPLQKYTAWGFETNYPFKAAKNIPATQIGARGLLDLPDELLLWVVSELRATRLDQPQSLAFRNKHKESDRQDENFYRKYALYGLCLTSKRLNRLAIPALYDAVLGSTTNYGLGRLRLIWRTLTEKEELRYHVRYVENLLEDCLGNRLSADLEDLEDLVGAQLVTEYFSKLAWIVRMCPNIAQMSVISIESNNFTFWNHVLDPLDDGQEEKGGGDLSGAPKHILCKLKKLTLQTNVSRVYRNEPSVEFDHIYSEILKFSPLVELRACGVAAMDDVEVFNPGISSIPLGTTIESLQRIEITQCSLPLESVDKMLSACNSLRHFFCHWVHLRCEMSHRQVNLLPNLQRHRKSLQTLCLMGNLATFGSTTESWVSFPSLCQMTALKEAKLCNLFLPDSECRKRSLSDNPTVPIAPELAPALEDLTISYNMYYLRPETWGSSVLARLQRLAADCTQYLPRLRDLTVQYEGGEISPWAGDDEDLVRRFGEKGIHLSIVKDVDVLAMIGQE
ncbi:hypothetical protein PMIN04_008508 [Paraphaeosphaeria minitans]